MKPMKSPRLILLLIISLTIISAEVNQYLPLALQEKLESGKDANILLIGIDARPGEIQARSDTIILVSINESRRKAVLVSIPRDTRIVFQGSDRKINMVNQYEGPPGLCLEVGKLMNTDLSHYIAVNFAGFEEIVDTMGGVFVDVDIRLHSPGTGVFLEKGYQRLSGKEALAYARFRSSPDADIGRTKRQQRLLAAMATQVMQKENLFRIPQLVPRLWQNVSTNIKMKDLYYLGGIAGQFNEDEIITQTLPGQHYFSPESGASYWEPDRDLAKNLIKKLFEGKRYEVDQSLTTSS